jgi:hypothetical protein
LRVWDITLPSRKEHSEAKPTTRDLTLLWSDLADQDARRAYRALCTLTRWPDQAVATLQERLRPAPPTTRTTPRLTPQQIEQRVADLDSDEFSVRQKAAEELTRLGEPARPALEKFLAGKPSLDARRRAEQVLARVVSWPVTSPERLRELRSVEVLERIATPDARRLLEQLKLGAADADLTREAKAALERLAKRPEGRR